MSRLAPGRTHDIQMLLDRRDNSPKFSAMWNKAQMKIDDLIEEGKCNTLHSLRGRLLNAARAYDNDEILKISKQIDQHMKTHHRRRFMRGWLKKG